MRPADICPGCHKPTHKPHAACICQDCGGPKKPESARCFQCARVGRLSDAERARRTLTPFPQRRDLARARVDRRVIYPSRFGREVTCISCARSFRWSSDSMARSVVYGELVLLPAAVVEAMRARRCPAGACAGYLEVGPLDDIAA